MVEVEIAFITTYNTSSEDIKVMFVYIQQQQLMFTSHPNVIISPFILCALLLHSFSFLPVL